jgi:hypothetical protein
MPGKVIEGVVGVIAVAAAFLPGVAGTPLGMALLYTGSTLLGISLTPHPISLEQQGINVNDVSTTTPLPVVYGETMVGVSIADIRTSRGFYVNPPNGDLYIMAMLCHGSRNGHGIERIGEIRVDDRVAYDDAGVAQDPWSTTDVHKSLLFIAKYRGTSTEVVDPSMHHPALFPISWPTTSYGRWVAHFLFNANYVQDTYQSGLPNLTVKVKGCRVYDPRNPTGGPDGDGFAWSTNVALCILDYMMAFYGCGIDVSEIDLASFITAANQCDTMVTIPGGGSQKKFEMNGAIDTGREPGENLQEMLAACRGMLIYDNGMFRIVIRDTVSYTAGTLFQLNRDNIVGGFKFRTPGTDDAPNIVIMTYIDPTKKYQPVEVQFPDVADVNTFLAEDNGFESRLEAQLRLVTDAYRARQLGMVTIKERRFGKPFELVVTEEALSQRTGDLIEITHDVPGYALQPAWIMGMSILPGLEGHVKLIGFTYDPNMYVLDAQVVTPALAATDLPDPFTTEPVSNVQAFTGTRDPRIRVTWSPSNDNYIGYYLVQAQRLFPYDLADATMHTVGRFEPGEQLAYIPGAADGEQWAIQVIAVNVNGKQSAPVTIYHTVVIVKVAQFTYVVTPMADVIQYEITFGVEAQYVEFFTVENDASGGDDPPETSEYSGGYLDRKDGEVLVKQIQIRPGRYRKTKMVAWDVNWRKGLVSSVIESSPATGGTGPAGAPTWDTPEATLVTQTSMRLHLLSADVTAESRLYKNGTVIKTAAAGVLFVDVTGLGINEANTFRWDHIKSGIPSVMSDVRLLSTLGSDPPPSAFTYVDTVTYQYGPKFYVRHELAVAGASSATHEVYESQTTDPLDGYKVGETNVDGEVFPEKLINTPGDFYYFARTISPLSDWVALDDNPLDYSGA